MKKMIMSQGKICIKDSDSEPLMLKELSQKLINVTGSEGG